ncbi:Radical SAM domain protein [Dethiosulfovibrio peptidovorans DSM 11002]|uniref:Radical SAM domain protein n=1 Tax=Dethiosulfovibrio peptidovorans DSM 11002 TaxID=469381 RepID=D2Z7J0_9BACT|nr:TIGR01212 family radical SAM protein [Dethiosulfovibrio peptidovorans]EFC91437.1 Radical SAM domain protein [Dethiosulfovibrio peptidovorans DSM 11002]
MLYRKWSADLRRRFGYRVQKISLDIGSGCPNRNGLGEGGCVFCDSSGGGNGAWMRGESLELQVRKGMKSAVEHYKAKGCILYFQSYSSTYGPLDRLKEAIEKARVEASRHLPVWGLAVGTRPDLVSGEVVSYLSSLCRSDFEVWLELGVQTTDEDGLKWLRRGHDLTCVEDTLDRCLGESFSVSAHLIAGIPGEREDQLLRSARWLLDRGITGLKFHPLYVLRDTPLEDLYMNGLFEPLSMDRYVSKVAEVLALEGSRFVVQRLTADVWGGRLVAPSWLADKNGVMAAIDEKVRSRLGV